MITTAIITTFSFLMGGLIGLLPSIGSLPSQIDDTLTFLVPMWSAWNNVLPLTDLLIIITSVLTIELIIFTFNVSVWLYNKIRGSG